MQASRPRAARHSEPGRKVDCFGPGFAVLVFASDVLRGLPCEFRPAKGTASPVQA